MPSINAQKKTPAPDMPELWIEVLLTLSLSHHMSSRVCSRCPTAWKVRRPEIFLPPEENSWGPWRVWSAPSPPTGRWGTRRRGGPRCSPAESWGERGKKTHATLRMSWFDLIVEAAADRTWTGTCRICTCTTFSPVMGIAQEISKKVLSMSSNYI